MEYHFINYLKKNDLRDPKDLLNYIYTSDYSELIDFCQNVSLNLEHNDLSHTGPATNSIFNFTACPTTVGFSSACLHPGHKLNQVNDFINFSLFYADTVCIPNIFPMFFDEDDLTSDQLTMFRANLFGNCLVLIRLRELIESNIAAFVPTTLALCSECGSLLEDSWSKIESRLLISAQNVVEDISKETEFILFVEEGKVYINSFLPTDIFDINVFTVEIQNPSKTITDFISYKKSIELMKPVQMDNNEILRSGLLEEHLLEIVPWARLYLFSSIFMPSKFLTSSPSDTLILDGSLPSDIFKLSNKNIRENIPLNLPLLDGLSASDLLKVRNSDYDAFIKFRSKILELQKEFLSKNGEISDQDSIQIFEDIVYPGIDQVDTKLRSLRTEFRKDSIKKLVITAAVLTIGISTGLLPPNLENLIQIAGACELIDSATSIWKSLEIPEEVKLDPFYFLWKVKREI